METNETTPAHYVVTETFYNHISDVAIERKTFEGGELLTCRKKAINYCISQLEEFNSGGISVDEDLEPSDDWWRKFENVEVYQSYLYLVVGDNDFPIACADEVKEEGPLKLEQLMALKSETDVLAGQRVTVQN